MPTLVYDFTTTVATLGFSSVNGNVSIARRGSGSGNGYLAVGDFEAFGSDLRAYDAGGTSPFGVSSLVGGNASLTTLNNGTIVWVGQDEDSIVYQILDGATGGDVLGLTDIGDTDSSNADVAALTNGRFAIASQDNIGSHSDIEIRVFTAGGANTVSWTVNSTTADDRNASIIGLSSGNIAVAWQRAVGAETEIWLAVYTPGGAAIRAPSLVDTGGTINRNVSLAATNDGFVMAYEDNGWDGDIDITLARFTNAGVFVNEVNATPSSATDANPYLSVLGNGLVLLGYDNGPSGNRDVHVSAFDPALAALGTAQLSGGQALTDDSYGIAVTAFGAGGVAAFWTNASDGTVNGQELRLRVTITGDATDETIANTTGLVATINGLGGNDTLTSTGNDIVDGGEGNDVIHAGLGFGGNQMLNGGADNDTIVSALYAAGTDYVINLVTGATNFNGESFINFENARGGDSNDTIIGTGDANFLYGNGGNDYLIGGGGSDYLDGELGTNTLQGGTGDDRYFITGTTDSIVEFAGEGDDTTFASVAVHTLANNVERLVSYFGGSFLGIGNALDNQIFGGNSQRDELHGREGDDALSDGSGAAGFEDTMLGGLGNDYYYVGVRGSSTIELPGEGYDTVQTNFSIYGLQANIEGLVAGDDGIHAALVGNNLNNDIIGGTGRDDLFGREGNDRLYGGTGAANTLLGQEGDDLYYVEAAGDSVIEFVDQGNDFVTAAVASFTLGAHVEHLSFAGADTARIGVGNDQANIIRGLGGDDSLNGLAGNDFIYGGSGSDLLQGGVGADQFRYEGGETGIDRILDFATLTDDIVLSQAFFTPTPTVAFVSGVGAVANTANSTILYDPSTGIVSYDDDGNGAGAPVALAQLNAGQVFTASDFFFA